MTGNEDGQSGGSVAGSAGKACTAGEAEACEQRVLPAAAMRALAEAAERRARIEQAAKAAELGGRAGPDPVRYGDWENGGIASDF